MNQKQSNSSNPLDVDKLVADSNSVDDLMKAVNMQATQLHGTMQVASVMGALKSLFSPSSTAGIASGNSRDAYIKYATDAQINGELAMRYDQWITEQQKSQKGK